MSEDTGKPADGEEAPKKVDVELNLDDLDKVSGGGGIGGAIRSPRPPASPSPEPVNPGIFQIEAI